MWTREQIAERAAREIPSGAVVNLGIGIPTLVAQYLENKGVWLHSENGILGMGPFPLEGQEDPQVINAGKQTVTVKKGGSTFDSSLSFSMIRGGHIDIAMLGAMQVSCAGDLANWAIPGGRVMGIGGGMDLAANAKKVVVLTMHTTRKGQPKLVANCDFPLTASGVVCRVVTNLGVFDCVGDHFGIVEIADGVTRQEIVDKTGTAMNG